MRRLLFGLSAGVAAGYTIYRSIESLRALQNPPPVLPKDAAAYGAVRRSLEVSGTIRSIVSAAAFSAGGGPAILSRSVARAPAALRPSLFALAGLFLGAAIDLPCAFVEEHELERRFGLTEQPAREWLIEHLKAMAISAAVMSVLSVPFSMLLRKRPDTWPLSAALGLAPLFVLAGIVVPVYVAPLFNEFEAVRGPLEDRLRALAGRYGAGDADILRMDMSRQTKKANAYVTGMFDTHRIVIGDTLLEAFPEAEIEFVVAHELGHYVSRDTWRMMGVGLAAACTVFALANSMISSQERRRYDDPAVIYRLYVWMLVFSTALRPPMFAFSRSREWAADRFALEATQDGRMGAAAFRRLREQNLAEEEVPRWYEFLFSTHPSLGARIAKLDSHG